MNTTLEKLEELRDGRIATIKGHKGHIESLEGEIDRLEGEVRGLELAIKLCSEGQPSEANHTPALIGKYADMGLTDAVLDVVKTAGNPPGLTPREIVSILEAEGFKTQSKDLYNSVYPVAMGLAEQDKIEEGKKDGKRCFMRK
jgi:hypothetical protein